MFVKIPEEVGIYKSILTMSVSRGDDCRAQLAHNYLLVDHFQELKECIVSTSLFNFSVLPEEVLVCSPETSWAIVSGMCNSLPDYRALSLSILYFRNKLNDYCPGAWKNIRPFLWKLSDSPVSYREAVVAAAVAYLGGSTKEDNCVIVDDYFSYNKSDKQFGAVTQIPWEYYSGPKSWISPYIVNFLSSLTRSREIAVSILEYLEYYKTTMDILFPEEWAQAKEVEFDDVTKRERQWETELKPQVEEMVKEFLQLRLPIL